MYKVWKKINDFWGHCGPICISSIRGRLLVKGGLYLNRYSKHGCNCTQCTHLNDDPAEAFDRVVVLKIIRLKSPAVNVTFSGQFEGKKVLKVHYHLTPNKLPEILFSFLRQKFFGLKKVC